MAAPAAPVEQRYLLLGDATAGPGTVRAAYDTLLDRKVALRFLGSAPGDDAANARVLAEAAAVARLAHPNVVTVHDVGVLDGVPFLAMEQVDGVNLAVWRTQRRRSLREIAQVLAAAARGLAAAHAAGIVHGQVTPAHIVVTGARVLVTDFGPAPAHTGGTGAEARDDVYGLCATLYFLLHGQPPPAATPLSGRSHLHRLAARGVDPDPARRPADMDALATALLADPGARRRTVALVLGAALAVGGAFAGGSYLTANPERQCRAGADAIAAAWNDGHRVDARRRFAQAGQSLGFEGLERRLDRYVDSWRAMYADNCQASYGRKLQSDQVFDLRMQCLAAQQAALAAFVGALGAATPGQLVRAGGAILPVAADCGRAERADTKPLPVDPEAREQLRTIQNDLGRSEAEQNLGDYARAQASASRALDVARKLAYEPVLAAAFTRLGTVVMRLQGNAAGNQPGGLDRAAGLFREAYAVAERGLDDRQRLAASVEQIQVQVYRGDYSEVERWLRLSNALLERLGRPPREDAQVAMIEGTMKANTGQRAAAGPLFKRALAAARRIDPPDERRLASAMGSACIAEGGLEVQIACYRQAVKQAVKAFGPEHPEVAHFYNNLGTLLSVDPALRREACDVFRQAMDLHRKNLEPRHPAWIVGIANLGSCYTEIHRFAEAERLLLEGLSIDPPLQERGTLLEHLNVLMRATGQGARAVETARGTVAAYSKVFGQLHYETNRAREHVYVSLRLAGRHAEALATVRETLALALQERAEPATLGALYNSVGWAEYEARLYPAALHSYGNALRVLETIDPAAPPIDFTLHGLGVVSLRLRRPEQARGHLERALAMRPANDIRPLRLRGHSALALAQALAASGQDHPRACALAGEAARIFGVGADPEDVAKTSEARRFVAQQRCAGHGQGR